jgi:hypothetical protein
MIRGELTNEASDHGRRRRGLRHQSSRRCPDRLRQDLSHLIKPRSRAIGRSSMSWAGLVLSSAPTRRTRATGSWSAAPSAGATGLRERSTRCPPRTRTRRSPTKPKHRRFLDGWGEHQRSAFLAQGATPGPRLAGSLVLPATLPAGMVRSAPAAGAPSAPRLGRQRPPPQPLPP